MFGKNPVAADERATRGEKLSLVKGSPFYTIQGEGPHVGEPAVFVRLHGCSLRCTFSFGWFPNSGREPYITMSDGPKKKLSQVRESDPLLTLKTDGQLTETGVLRVTRYEVDQWVRAKLGRWIYYMTPEHPIFTNRGLVLARDLVAGDQVLHTIPSDVIAYKKIGARNPMRDHVVAARAAASACLAVHNGVEVAWVQHVNRMQMPPSLRPRPLPITSLTCGPHPSYLADMMWHHNCDTNFSDPDDPVLQVYPDLVQEVISLAGEVARLVVITGGEPTRQNIIPLIAHLQACGFTVQIETAGIYWLNGLEHAEIVCSPKTPIITPEIYQHAIAFKYVIDYRMEFDGFIPITATQPGARPARLAPPRFGAPVFLSPMDTGDPNHNRENRRKVAELSLRYGVRAGVQLHKILMIDEPA